MNLSQLDTGNELMDIKKEYEGLLTRIREGKEGINRIDLMDSDHLISTVRLKHTPCLKDAVIAFILSAEKALTEAIAGIDAEFEAL